MHLIELQHALRQLRLGGIATVLETRLRQAQAEAMAPIDLISCLVADELTRRGDRLLQRRRKQAAFRDPQKTLDHFDFTFNPKMNRSLVFDLATCAFIGKREDAFRQQPQVNGIPNVIRPLHTALHAETRTQGGLDIRVGDAPQALDEADSRRESEVASGILNVFGPDTDRDLCAHRRAAAQGAALEVPRCERRNGYPNGMRAHRADSGFQEIHFG